MEKSQEAISKGIQARECREYITETVKAIREELYKMMAESPEKAVEAHYTVLALNKIYGRIQSDVNAMTREVRRNE
jgi:hypothetical protein